MTTRNVGALAAAAGALALALTGLGRPLHARHDPEAPPAADTPTVVDAIEAARQALRAGRPEEAARLLKPLDRRALDPEAARRYDLHARDAALRTGDREWLERVNDVPDRFAFADGYVILTAWSYLKAADFAAARRYLEMVKDFDHLNEREKRRYLTILARIEQFEGRADAERDVAEKLVDYLGRWTTPTCMGCHENRDHPGDVPTFDPSGWWAGGRYVALLRGRGDAEAVAERAADRLERQPTDDAARLRLAYALRALGREADAAEQFDALFWAPGPDRDPIEPRDILTFP